MSTGLAIAAVTKTLENLLFTGIQQAASGLGSYDVKTNTPDLAAPAASANASRLNLFLYGAAVNGAWRNRDLPGQVKPGETARPPLALNLLYLLTAYGPETDPVAAHKLLGHGMRVLHDYTVLSPDDLKLAMVEANVHLQPERIRVAPHPLPLEEMSKLWAMFQTQYRLSVAYEVSVVLIESQEAPRTPLPVLVRSVGAQPDLMPPFPTLLSAEAPFGEPGAELGQILTLKGYRLSGTSLSARITNPRLSQSIELTPLAGATETQVQVQLPPGGAYDPAGGPSAVPANWRADWGPGLYTISLLVGQGADPARRTAEIPVVVAPKVVAITPSSAAPDLDGSLTYTVECQPQVLPDQQAFLLLGDRTVAAAARVAVTDTLTFEVQPAVAGTYITRLRVDGADSLIIDHSTTPATFFPTAEVTVL